MWSDVRQLIRVRSVETSDALLLSPTQAYYARENLKLRLLNARMALLSRNESAFRSDMTAAQDSIAKYFDTRARQTQTAQAMLKQVQVEQSGNRDADAVGKPECGSQLQGKALVVLTSGFRAA